MVKYTARKGGRVCAFYGKKALKGLLGKIVDVKREGSQGATQIVLIICSKSQTFRIV